MAILRTEKAMVRAMRGVKVLGLKNSKEFIDLLSMEKSLDRVVKASSCGNMVMF